MSGPKKIVLAYSGGLDTSVILALAQGDLRRGDRGVHRRPRPGRGADPRPREGPPDGRQLGAHRGPPRGVRPRLRVPRAAGQRHLRGRVSPRHLLRAAADREGAGGSRAGRGRGRRRPRRDRQGERPGALRADLRGPGARPQGRRPLAGLGAPLAHRPHGVRGAAGDSGPDHARPPVLDGPEPLPHLVRGRDPRGPVGRAAGEDVPADPLARGGAGRAPPRWRSTSRRAIPSRWTASGSARSRFSSG